MTLLTFKSPGVSTREIDLSGPTENQPAGVPAGVIGTSVRGPAFVPITVATFQDFISKFGNTDGEKFGPLAMNEWLRNATAGTYVRLLGVGDGKKRTTQGDNAGRVNNAGFVVGTKQVQNNGNVGGNTYSTSTKNPAGATYFLGAFHSASAGSTIFRDIGLDYNRPRPIVRGVLMAPSGVVPTLGSKVIAATNSAWKSDARSPGGGALGYVDVRKSKQEFVLILNGHTETDAAANVITASFDPHAPNYISKILNRDPTKIEERGHYLYSHFDVHQTQMSITSSHVAHDAPEGFGLETAFLLSSSLGRNTGSATTSTQVGVPNFENFEDRFRTARSPFVISQKFGGRNKNLFRVHALDDGRAGSDAFKITIDGIQASSNENDPYGTFNLNVRFFGDSDLEPVYLETFKGLDLNPSSDNFIGRRIGDTHTYYDFDKSAGSQKLVVDGVYPNVSNYIRVELSNDLRDGSLNDLAIPVGFRGLDHLVTSGSAGTNGPAGGSSILTGSVEHPYVTYTRGEGVAPSDLVEVIQLPVPMRDSVATGVSPKIEPSAKLTWGVQFEKKDSLTEPNKHQKLEESIRSFVRYMPNFHTTYQNPVVGGNEGTADVSGSILDADRFNNNMFTLEKIQVITGSGNTPDTKQWAAARYRRDGVLRTITDIDGTVSTKTRFLNTGKDLQDRSTRRFLKFTFPLQGGFDGVNIFDKSKSRFEDAALRREMDDETNQGGTSGPTVAAYRKAVRVMEEKSDVDIQLLAIPGIRHESITDFAIESVERRFDALYLMDLEERDTLNNPVTSSASVINVGNTVNRHASRNFDTSFAATYFPDVVMQDPATKTNVQCPPSVAVLGAFAYNDAVAHPWFAPAGFNRGALSTTIEEQVKLNRANLDDLYEADINPVTSFGASPGVVIWGQKTMLAGQSALDRVNVRRLLIDIRRQVKGIANGLLFEPNRESTLGKFSNAVSPILSRIQQQQGLDRFRVQIDTSTTTQADVENNTIRGKIFLQPTRSVEFISLDFVVTNAGVE